MNVSMMYYVNKGHDRRELTTLNLTVSVKDGSTRLKKYHGFLSSCVCPKGGVFIVILFITH